MSEAATLKLLISGVVQGVGFRWSAARKAEELELAGWVQNLPDGRVAALVSGPRSQVEAFAEWAKKGPASARVTGLEREESTEAVSGGFEIRR